MRSATGAHLFLPALRRLGVVTTPDHTQRAAGPTLTVRIDPPMAALSSDRIWRRSDSRRGTGTPSTIASPVSRTVATPADDVVFARRRRRRDEPPLHRAPTRLTQAAAVLAQEVQHVATPRGHAAGRTVSRPAIQRPLRQRLAAGRTPPGRPRGSPRRPPTPLSREMHLVGSAADEIDRGELMRAHHQRPRQAHWRTIAPVRHRSGELTRRDRPTPPVDEGDPDVGTNRPSCSRPVQAVRGGKVCAFPGGRPRPRATLSTPQDPAFLSGRLGRHLP